MDDLRDRADARLDAALRERPIRDPRPALRRVLKVLRQRDDAAFQRALRHFDQVLLPAVAGDADPLAAWLAYGRLLAELVGPGRTVAVNGTGRAAPVAGGPDSGGPVAGDPAAESPAATSTGDAALLFHLPEDDTAPAVLLQCPRETTPAQEASIELLVLGRVTASAYD